MVNIRARDQFEVVTGGNRHVLTLYLHVTIRGRDADTRKGIHIHLTEGRVDGDSTFVG